MVSERRKLELQKQAFNRALAMEQKLAKQKIAKTLKGHKHSEETKQKMSEIQKGRIFSEEHKCKLSKAQKGRKISKETKQKISETLKNMPEETKQKMSEAHKGIRLSDKTRKRMSATFQGISYDEWESFACDSPYCPKFNEKCRESNREKYNRKCFLTGLSELENITKTGKQKKLSVHHVDMDKGQGCDGKRWKLVPICIAWHGRIHNDLWKARIIWLLNNVWV